MIKNISILLLLFALSGLLAWSLSKSSGQNAIKLYVSDAYRHVIGIIEPFIHQDEQQRAEFIPKITSIPKDRLRPDSPVIFNGSHKSRTFLDCTAPPSRKRDTQGAVYKWTGQNGRLNISNIKPKDPVKDLRIIRTVEKDDFFTLKIDRQYSKLSTTQLRKVESGVTLIYRLLIDIIGVKEVRHINLNLTFIDNKSQFERYKSKVSSTLSASATGFYNNVRNEAVVYSGMGKKITARIALHEATHAIISAMFGTTTPAWLNEGLASYMEEIEVQGTQTRRVGHDPMRVKNMRTLPTPHLNTFLNYSREEWYRESELDRNYAFSWGVVRYLMSSKNGIRVLQEILNRLMDNNCAKIDSIEHINHKYAGGISSFEKGWNRWIKESKIGTQVF